MSAEPTEPITDEPRPTTNEEMDLLRAASKLYDSDTALVLRKLIARIDLERNRADEAERKLADLETRALVGDFCAEHTCVIGAEARATAAEEECERYRLTLWDIAARHPDGKLGEHPAVDIARTALWPEDFPADTQEPTERMNDE